MPDTPPRYRFSRGLRGGSDSEDDRGPTRGPSQAGVLAARKRTASAGKGPIKLSREQDRQRRGAADELPGAWSFAHGAGGLAAPILLPAGSFNAGDCRPSSMQYVPQGVLVQPHALQPPAFLMPGMGVAPGLDVAAAASAAFAQQVLTNSMSGHTLQPCGSFVAPPSPTPVSMGGLQNVHGGDLQPAVGQTPQRSSSNARVRPLTPGARRPSLNGYGVTGVGAAPAPGSQSIMPPQPLQVPPGAATPTRATTPPPNVWHGAAPTQQLANANRSHSTSTAACRGRSSGGVVGVAAQNLDSSSLSFVAAAPPLVQPAARQVQSPAHHRASSAGLVASRNTSHSHMPGVHHGSAVAQPLHQLQHTPGNGFVTYTPISAIGTGARSRAHTPEPCRGTSSYSLQAQRFGVAGPPASWMVAAPTGTQAPSGEMSTGTMMPQEVAFRQQLDATGPTSQAKPPAPLPLRRESEGSRLEGLQLRSVTATDGYGGRFVRQVAPAAPAAAAIVQRAASASMSKGSVSSTSVGSASLPPPQLLSSAGTSSSSTATPSGGRTPTRGSTLQPSASAHKWTGLVEAAAAVATAGVSDRPRVLITGATGLLGRQVVQAFSDGSWEVRGLRRLRGGPPLVHCDLTVEGAALAQVEEFRPHVVLHLATERRAEALRRSPVRARLLNVDATRALAAACEATGAWFVYISAACVFDGTSPPYGTDALPNPICELGWHKLHGEKLTLAASPRAAILRVPILYGPLDGSFAESECTNLLEELQSGVREVDDWQVFYPAWTPDVAGVLRELAELHHTAAAPRGILHWQGGEALTRHQMMRVVAEAAGLDASLVAARRTTATAAAAHDVSLDCSKVGSLVRDARTRYQTPFKEGIKLCLAPYLAALERRMLSTPREVISFPGDLGAEVVAQPSDTSRTSREAQKFRDELRARGAALQELFWQELERTRGRLREAGYLDGASSPSDPVLTAATEAHSKESNGGSAAFASRQTAKEPSSKEPVATDVSSRFHQFRRPSSEGIHGVPSTAGRWTSTGRLHALPTEQVI
eukprot:TRINITY_DN26538_c0_g1_i1.p1 TRINITY_DN26538_c0_g1~~TRINITY_DN26538_c0_g1_i1.p1  ORF type:complete len:1041 (-),score=157.79 TRINITY_DN26538_c0_g1_i1:93-3215(-)